MEANQAKLPELSMHPIMEMRPLAALENYVDVMRDTPFFVHPTRPSLPPRLSPLLLSFSSRATT